MASETSVRLGTPPDRLWIQKPGIYEDEEGRTWVTVVVRFSPSHREWARASNTQGSASQGSTVSPEHGGRLWEGCALTLARVGPRWGLEGAVLTRAGKLFCAGLGAQQCPGPRNTPVKGPQAQTYPHEVIRSCLVKPRLRQLRT